MIKVKQPVQIDVLLSLCGLPFSDGLIPFVSFMALSIYFCYFTPQSYARMRNDKFEQKRFVLFLYRSYQRR